LLNKTDKNKRNYKLIKGGAKVNIRKLDINERLPMELLLLADPSKSIVEEYVYGGNVL